MLSISVLLDRAFPPWVCGSLLAPVPTHGGGVIRDRAQSCFVCFLCLFTLSRGVSTHNSENSKVDVLFDAVCLQARFNPRHIGTS